MGDAPCRKSMRFITENPASKTPFQSPVEVLPFVVCIALVEILCEKRVVKKNGEFCAGRRYKGTSLWGL